MSDKRIFLSPPDVGELEGKLVSEALDSGWAAPAGPFLELFEGMVAEVGGRKHAVALASGTAALHLGILALGVRPGDVVICSTLTFVATANAILYSGAVPVFVDSEPSSGNISPALLETAIKECKKDGQRIGAVIPVDFLGSVAPAEEIVPICKRYGVPVLWDSAESLGSTRRGLPAGSFGDAAIFSFNGNKIATTSGGGAFLTDSAKLADRVRYLSMQSREPAVHYEHKEIGFNYRMSNVLAALGVGQLTRLDSMIEARRGHKLNYKRLFDGVPGVTMFGDEDIDNCWLSAVSIDPGRARLDRDKLYLALSRVDIESRPLWKPMHMQELFRGSLTFVDGSAERIFSHGLALPSGSGMSETDWIRIENALSSALL